MKSFKYKHLNSNKLNILVFLKCVLLFCLITTTQAFSQGITITGTVTDNLSEPLPGVNVMVKGSSIGQVTDVNGRYTITVPNTNAVLVFSYIGYVPAEYDVGNQTTINVQLREDVSQIEEIVVIGYGTVKKSDLTGAVSSVTDKSFKDQPVKSVGEILQGRSAGVQVTTLSGLPGQTPYILIRGTTSLNKSSTPLYVIDGIIGGSVPNVADIQSMEILKDASATAIYGSRGANGVVLITTKRGSEGKPIVSVDAQWGFSSIIKKYDLLNPYDYAIALQDVAGVVFPADELAAYKNGTKGIDWQDLITQTGVSQDYKLSISGGTAKTQYYVSANLLDETAITVNTKHNRYQFRTNLNTEVTKWLDISTNLNVSQTKTHNLFNNFESLLVYSPSMELKNEETGVYNLDPYNSVLNNPYGLQMETQSDSYSNRLIGNFDVKFKIIDGLTLSIQNGLIFTNSPSYSFQSSKRTLNEQSTMSNSNSNSIYWQNTNNLTYFKTFGDHQITATAVWETSQSESKSLNISGSSLANEVVGYYNYLNAATRTGGNSYSAYAIASGLGRLMYVYKNRYMVTGTFRADGSSKFQGDNKWGYFPSGSLAWDVAKEDFFSDQNLFQQLKLRGSYGVTGNQDIDVYSTLGMLSSNTYSYGTTTRYSGYWENTFPTPNISWEKVYQFDIGLDASMLNNRINISIDAYQKNSKDLLLQKTIPNYNGGGSIWVNMGEVKNIGLEFTIDAFAVRKKDFVWQSILTGSFQKNEIINMGGEEWLQTALGSTYGGYFQIYHVGYPIGSFYLYDWAGIDDEGCNLYRKLDGSLTRTPDGEDRYVLGQGYPKSTFGWNNMLRWKNWSLNVFMNAALGVDRQNLLRTTLSHGGGSNKYTTLAEAYFKNWDNVENKADAKFSSLKNGNNRRIFMSTQWLENASFMKMKNLSLSYQIPKDVLKVAEANITFSVQNIFTITKYKGMDPETYYGLGGQGVDLGAYPVPRTYTFGLMLNF